MTEHRIIIIFTKDRPAVLNKTLGSIESINYPKYIIDDSVNVDNQKKVFEISGFYKCNYLGKDEFNKFTSNYNIDFPKFNFLLREPGSSEWNLGYVRNFGLLFSKAISSDKVLFMDDDIMVHNLNLIDTLFETIDKFQFVGANISGLVDDSVLGHIATDLGVFNERMLSGGFMVFSPKNIDNYFMNNYNEDWIWLFLQLKEKKYLQTGDVIQELSNPFDNYQSKVIFQEQGEIALDGILNLFKEDSYDTLTNIIFWKKMLAEREIYLDLLCKKAKKQNKSEYVEIIEYTKQQSTSFKAEAFSELFKEYFTNRIHFNRIYKSLN